ncbi:MAG: RIP metalloprotease RseP [Bacteroidales bacterium]|jgi:regulator of sigma E protease|nr:RIP metalloprotease RseP [Bacteroidales bacterium]
MEILIKAAQFILSLSILIIAHEMGHFFFAKLFRTRVEKFYLFFDPWFSLFKVKKGETEYGVGWLPLGGYVKISGMIDESMDTEQLKQPPQPWEFRSKPAWQRLLIMMAGVVVNFVLALFIYSMIIYVWGIAYVPMQNAVYGYTFCETALNNGFRNGDKIIAVDGVTYQMIPDAFNAIIIDKARTVTVERDGQQTDIALPDDFADRYVASGGKGFASLNYPWVIESTSSGLPAEKAGLQHGDRIVAIDETPVPWLELTYREIRKYAGQTIQVTIERNGAEQTLPVAVTQDSIIGITAQKGEKVLNANHITYGFWESFPAGIRYGVDKLTTYVKSLGLLFSKAGVKQLGGFIAIGNIFPPEWDWASFWELTAFLSIILAFMNILPIPALDGGHVLFLLVEIISRHKPGDKFLEKAQIVGMFILIALLLLANGNDIIRLFSQ